MTHVFTSTITVVTKQALFSIHGHQDQTECPGVLTDKDA